MCSCKVLTAVIDNPYIGKRNADLFSDSQIVVNMIAFVIVLLGW